MKPLAWICMVNHHLAPTLDARISFEVASTSISRLSGTARLVSHIEDWSCSWYGFGERRWDWPIENNELAGSKFCRWSSNLGNLKMHERPWNSAASHSDMVMGPLSRAFAGLLRKDAAWICSSCTKSMRQPSRTTPFFKPSVRNISNFSKPKQNVAPTMEQMRAPFKTKNSSTLYYTLSIILGTVAFSYGSVPMYKMVRFWKPRLWNHEANCALKICQTTGWGGQPIKAPGHGGPEGNDPSIRLQPVTTAKRIRITFNGSVSDVLPWKFIPQQREVRVLPGETALAFYTATNKSDEDIIGVATYSVTPGQVAPYFSKIQCFCFEEQRLNAGETVDMPVFFYIDPDFVNDPNMRGIEQVTLSYTFFSELCLKIFLKWKKTYSD